MSSEIRRLSERTFTSFNDRSVSLLKTHHRSTMLKERLNGRLLMVALHVYINKDISLYYDAATEENSRKNYCKFQLLA